MFLPFQDPGEAVGLDLASGWEAKCGVQVSDSLGTALQDDSQLPPPAGGDIYLQALSEGSSPQEAIRGAAGELRLPVGVWQHQGKALLAPTFGDRLPSFLP